MSIFAIPFCGYYPDCFLINVDYPSRTFSSYDENSKVKAWHITVPTLFIGITLLWYVHGTLGAWLYAIGVVVAVVALIILFAFILTGGIKDTFIGDYIEAKTKGICPLIEFKDDEQK
jgi:hypothetical protein